MWLSEAGGAGDDIWTNGAEFDIAIPSPTDRAGAALMAAPHLSSGHRQTLLRIGCRGNKFPGRALPGIRSGEARPVGKLIFALFFTLFGSVPAMADSIFPVSIPSECVELAQREGVPVMINSKYEAAKAKLKLARLSGRDPLVAQCRVAVERARIAMQAAAPARQLMISSAVP